MAIRVFFDSTEIVSTNIVGLTYNAQTNVNNFTLGTTICKEIQLDVINKGFESIPSKVYIKNENATDTLAIMYVDSVDNENQFFTSFHLVDYMLKTDFEYTANNIDVNTALSNALGNHWDVNQDLYGKDIKVNQKVNVRELIGYLAEINAGYAYVNPSDIVMIMPWKSNSTIEKKVEDCSSFTVGDYHFIDRVYLELAEATYYYPATTTNDTVYLNPNNILIGDNAGDGVSYTIQGMVEHIRTAINGYSFYNVSVNDMPIESVFPYAGQTIQFQLREGEYLVTVDGNNIITQANSEIRTVGTTTNIIPTILQCNLTYGGQWNGGLECELNTSEQEETTVSINSIINRVVINVDRQIGTIERTITDTNGQISQLIQDASGLTGYFANLDGARYIRLSSDGIQVSKTVDDGSVNITEDGVYIMNDQQKVVASMKANEFDTTNWIYSETRNGNCLNIYKRRNS